MRGIYWFRSDCRVQDNLALFQASQDCRDGLMAVYYLPKKTWARHHVSGCKVDFILSHLQSLQASLEALNIPLIVKKVDTFADCVDDLVALAEKHKIGAVYTNREYSIDEINRDAYLDECLKNLNIKNQVFDDSVLAPPGKILTPRQMPYTIFTPFKKAMKTWLARHGRLHPVKTPENQVEVFAKSTKIPTKLEGFKSHIDTAALWPAGEEEAHRRLKQFVKKSLANYHEDRNFPSVDGTSQLSAYLNIGAISPRLCFHESMSANHVKNHEAVETWQSELIWRDFYIHIAYHFPRVCKGFCFQEKYEVLEWDDNPKLKKAWMDGQTGFPLVDAAMRQLKETGWMHNRLRMLTAVFLTKLMYQDWRVGEQYFMEHLIDGAFEANNGGWQWSASTGTDAVPYFRIFNPMLQSEHFDPEGKFIKHYCPELKKLTAKEIHDPWKHCPEKVKALGYPEPIIDYANARKKTISIFKKLSDKKVERYDKQ